MPTMLILANAATGPSAWSNVTFSMTLLCVAGVAALLGAVPVVIARRRKLRSLPTVTLLAVFWAICSAADVGFGINQTLTDDARNEENLRTNYIDPAAIPAPPMWPWFALGPAFVVYAGIVGLAATKRT